MPKSDSSQEQAAHWAPTHSIVATVESELNDTNQPIVPNVNWPKKLKMQLIPKSLVLEVVKKQEKYFENAKAVWFHFAENTAVESVHFTRIFREKYVGCVHFHVSYKFESLF